MSQLEDLLIAQMRACGMDEPVREYRFAPPRRYRFDLAFPGKRCLAIEVEGGQWVNGAHQRGRHFGSDCTKYNLAVLLGWRVLRFTADMIQSGEAIATLEKALDDD